MHSGRRSSASRCPLQTYIVRQPHGIMPMEGGPVVNQTWGVVSVALQPTIRNAATHHLIHSGSWCDEGADPSRLIQSR